VGQVLKYQPSKHRSCVQTPVPPVKKKKDLKIYITVEMAFKWANSSTSYQTSLRQLIKSYVNLSFAKCRKDKRQNNEYFMHKSF
jgi:hypothetical protein